MGDLLRKMRASVKRFGQAEFLQAVIALFVVMHIGKALFRVYHEPDLGWTKELPVHHDVWKGIQAAPTVYRQAVPQVWHILCRWLIPAKAAMLIDFLFGVALIPLTVGLWLRWEPQSRSIVPFIPLIPAVSISCSLGNPLPERVVAIFVFTLVCYLVSAKKLIAVCIVAALSAFIRPEMPVIFGGLIFMCFYLFPKKILKKNIVPFSPIASSLGCVFVGIVYLALAKFVLWPNNHYDPQYPFFIFWKNLRHPYAIFFFPIYFAVTALNLSGLGVIFRQFQSCDTPKKWADAKVSELLFLNLSCLTWGLFPIFIASVGEIRVMMPSIPTFFILHHYLVTVPQARPACPRI